MRLSQTRHALAKRTPWSGRLRLWRLPARQPRARQSNSVDLDKARLVVSVGRGIGSKENIALAEQLCKAIGAELACSRPVAENEKMDGARTLCRYLQPDAET